jgi:hypothetical protein
MANDFWECPECGRQIQKDVVNAHKYGCHGKMAEPVVEPAKENPYNHETHTMYDCSEITESLCPSCLQVTAWQEGYETGKTEASEVYQCLLVSKDVSFSDLMSLKEMWEKEALKLRAAKTPTVEQGE